MALLFASYDNLASNWSASFCILLGSPMPSAFWRSSRAGSESPFFDSTTAKLYQINAFFGASPAATFSSSEAVEKSLFLIASSAIR